MDLRDSEVAVYRSEIEGRILRRGIAEIQGWIEKQKPRLERRESIRADVSDLAAAEMAGATEAIECLEWLMGGPEA